MAVAASAFNWARASSGVWTRIAMGPLGPPLSGPRTGHDGGHRVDQFHAGRLQRLSPVLRAGCGHGPDQLQRLASARQHRQLGRGPLLPVVAVGGVLVAPEPALLCAYRPVLIEHCHRRMRRTSHNDCDAVRVSRFCGALGDSETAGGAFWLMALAISDRPQARHCPRIRLSGFRGSLMLTRVASDPASLLRPAISTGTPRRNRGIETFGRRSSPASTAWVCCT
jgi:hypothetical protein